MFELRRQPSYQRRVPGNHADMIGVHDGRKSEKQWMQRGSRETASQPPVLSKAEPVTTGCWLAGRGGGRSDEEEGRGCGLRERSALATILMRRITGETRHGTVLCFRAAC